MSGHILVVDDEERIREVVEYALVQVGYRVSSACGGTEALARLEDDGESFDLVILDVLMPDLDGLEVCRRLRSRASTPVIFLSSRGEETDRVVGLELGGDDYVTKPFSPRELLARVRSVLRRTGDSREPRDVLRYGSLRVDVRRHELDVDGEAVKVTATEFGLLVAILAAEGEVLSRRQLIERAYDGSHHVSERTIDTHIKRLRRKLAAHELDPIATVNGVGYRAA